MKILEDLNVRGYLSISKIYPDGENELVYEDKNVIVSGMGFNLSYMFSRMGSDSITDFQIDKFQLGVSGNSAAQVSSTYQLSGPLETEEEYVGESSDSNLTVFAGSQLKNGSVVSTLGGGGDIIHASIPFSKVTKIDDTSVRYSIFVDEDSCNNLERDSNDAYLNEIGLLAKNPTDNNPEAPILVAYKYFSNIRKTSEFGLLFRWTISFG